MPTPTKKMGVPVPVYQRVMEIKQQMEAERAAANRARTEVTFGEVLEALLHHWEATSAMVRDAKASGQ